MGNTESTSRPAVHALSPAALAERRAAFEAVAMPLADILYASAYRMLGNSAKAEDLVQETYIRAWKNFDRFETGTNFKAWIFKIMIFVNRNDRRNPRSRDINVDFSAYEHPVAAAPEPDPVAAGRVNWEALYGELVEDEFKRALEHLDEDQRTVLMMVTLGELSYQEVSDTLGVPIGTVMSRLFRARKRLQEELHDYAKERGLLRKAGKEEAAG
ncbi:MAG: sigma-70 family RNA polymerase sigma factor [Planctomycetes bacterium]|nr:sigma-70 family RNA polymerase sigma factor [Planctomycetota bacterium]